MFCNALSQVKALRLDIPAMRSPLHRDTNSTWCIVHCRWRWCANCARLQVFNASRTQVRYLAGAVQTCGHAAEMMNE
jgi:hypothetical protein